MKKISVLMCIYKEPVVLIEKAINSILLQTYKNLELIVVADDPDNVLAIECVRDIEKKDKRISLYINEYNMGLPKSLNRALTFAKGDYIARMDADDISLPERFEKEVQVLQEMDYDLVASGIIRIDMEENVIGKSAVCFSPQNIYSLLKFTDVLPHPTWLAKKKLFDSLGGYREFFACEDYDFLLRAKKMNAHLGMAPYLLLKYRSNADGISQKNTLRQTLITHYLSANYSRINEVTQEEVIAYISDKMTYKSINNYAIHSEKFIQIAQKSKRSVRDTFEILKSIVLCKYISYNYMQVLWKKLHSVRGNQRMIE